MAKIIWNKVTWYSKLIAVFLFFVVLMTGMYIGGEFQKTTTDFRRYSVPKPSASEMSDRPALTRTLSTIYPLSMHYPGHTEAMNALRYQCGDSKLVATPSKFADGSEMPDSYDTIRLEPQNVELKKLDATATFTSFTFSRDCKTVYAIMSYNKGTQKDIVSYDYSGDFQKLSAFLYMAPKSPNDFATNSSSNPYFIYAIDDSKLLVSLITPTTGLDAYTNFTIHRIFNIASGEFVRTVQFAGGNPKSDYDNAYILPTTLLDIKNNILSNAVILNRTKLVRRDFDLISEKLLPTVALDSELIKGDQLNTLFYACEDQENRDDCLKTNFKNLFPDQQ